jgi:serine/threonine-protein kinase HipA
VSILPEGLTPRNGFHELVSDSVVRAHIDALPSLATFPDSEIRVSLGGLQDKLLLARVENQWALPKDGAPSTHILKPEIARFPGSADAEGWALAVSAALTETAEADVSRALADRPVLVVKRYDRTFQAEAITRLHQEDLCQALGLPPSSKYANEGSRAQPTFLALARILIERGEDPPAELVRLLQQLTLSIALRNADLHGKNLSILYSAAGAARLAPAYDVMTTTAFLPTQRHAGLTVDGKFNLSEIGTDHLVAEARSWGMPERTASDEIGRVLGLIPEAMASATERFPDAPASVRSESQTGVFLTSRAAPSRTRSRRRQARTPN